MPTETEAKTRKISVPGAGKPRAAPTLKTSADFKRLARQGRKWTGSAFTMQVMKRDDTAPFCVGYTVSRRVGNAVVRNRAKRRLREMTRLFLKTRPLTGVDVVLIAKTAAASLAFAALCADFERGLAATGVRLSAGDGEGAA